MQTYIHTYVQYMYKYVQYMYTYVQYMYTYVQYMYSYVQYMHTYVRMQKYVYKGLANSVKLSMCTVNPLYNGLGTK